MIQGIEKAAVGPTTPPLANAPVVPEVPKTPGTEAVPQVPGFMEQMAGGLNKVIPGFGLAGQNAGMYGGLGGAGLGAGGALLLHMLLAKRKNRKISDYLQSMLMGGLLGGGLGYFGGSQLAPLMNAQAQKDPALMARAANQATGAQETPADTTPGESPTGGMGEYTGKEYSSHPITMQGLGNPHPLDWLKKQTAGLQNPFSPPSR